MASFVIHSIAGERFLNLLESKYKFNFSTEQKHEFLLGNLIVDSTKTNFIQQDNETIDVAKKRYRKLVQIEKHSTHFRDNDDEDLCIQVPYLGKFENKYNNLLKENLFTIGYLFHLYTDKMFFEDLLNKSFEVLDENKQPTIYKSKMKFMRVKKDDFIYTIDEFWYPNNEFGIYNDYTIMNKILLEYYGSLFNKKELLNSSIDIINPGIEEIDINNIVDVLNKTELFINKSYDINDNKLSVFKKQDIIEFIDVVTQQFIDEYSELLEIYYKNSIKNKRR